MHNCVLNNARVDFFDDDLQSCTEGVFRLTRKKNIVRQCKMSELHRTQTCHRLHPSPQKRILSITADTQVNPLNVTNMYQFDPAELLRFNKCLWRHSGSSITVKCAFTSASLSHPAGVAQHLFALSRESCDTCLHLRWSRHGKRCRIRVQPLDSYTTSLSMPRLIPRNPRVPVIHTTVQLSGVFTNKQAECGYI